MHAGQACAQAACLLQDVLHVEAKPLPDLAKPHALNGAAELPLERLPSESFRLFQGKRHHPAHPCCLLAIQAFQGLLADGQAARHIRAGSCDHRDCQALSRLDDGLKVYGRPVCLVVRHLREAGKVRKRFDHMAMLFCRSPVP
ncbi:hypothetical protein FQZ97_798680 [compost metagenome]